MLEIWFVALPSDPLPSLFNAGPRFQDGPAAGGPRFKPLKYIKNIQKSSSSESLGLDA